MKIEISEKIIDIVENTYEYGKGNISPKSLSLATEFLLLYSRFEYLYMEEREKGKEEEKYKNIYELIDDVDNIELSKDFPRQEIMDYFRNRYVRNGKVNLRFTDLNFGQKGKSKEGKDLCKRVLEGDEKDELKCMLHIIYRYRNNIFHGTKPFTNIESQRENFEKSYQVLIELLKIKNIK